jgi:uncharacterized membrane protein YphA (DoxX/SURF4 family)
MFTLTRSGAAFLFAATILAWPVAGSAHVKWFVRSGAHVAPPAYFSLAEPAVRIWITAILVAVVVALLLDRYLPGPPERVRSFCDRHRQPITDLFQLLVGLALLLTAVKGAILAPHLAGVHGLGLALRFAEGTIGVLLIANKAVVPAAGSMVLLFLASTMLFGFVSSLEYFNFLGIALFLLLTRSPEGSWADRWKPYAAPLLRVHLGIALGVLAWTEKLMDPGLAMRFLEENELNFMKALGAPMFSDRLFVLSAGSTELLFAVVFALGLVTRINTLVLASFLISSNTYFFVVGKIDEAFLELTGHLPLFAIAIMLILHGSGNRLRLPDLACPGATMTPRPWFATRGIGRAARLPRRALRTSRLPISL